MYDLWVGLGEAVAPDVILFVLLGILLGYVIGVLPGLNRPVALAVAIPLSYYMSPISAIAFLVGIAKASGAGGATTAILLNTPGEINAAATCLDGYPLAREGHAKKALKVALYGSVTGDILGTLALIVLAQPLASLALGIGPVEMTAIMLLSLTFIAALSGRSLLRGLAAGLFGVFLSTVGLDIETATPRMTFGEVELLDGIPLVAITIGMLGLTEMFIQAQEIFTQRRNHVAPKMVPPGDGKLSAKEVIKIVPTMIQSSVIGIGVGILPGLGPSIASFISYAVAERTAKAGDRFRRGEIKGVAAAETADNAAVPASLVPLFALGLPGSVSAAILLAAFMIHGITPGPRLFAEHGQFMYVVYGAMLVASLMMLLVGRIGLVGFANLARVPATIVIPVVILLCILGAYVESQSLFAVQVTVVFAILGYLMEKFDYSRITFLIGFIVGPLLENASWQAMVITGAHVAKLLHHPVAMALFAAAIGVAIYFVKSRRTTPADVEG